jgi:hypothetical protein
MDQKITLSQRMNEEEEWGIKISFVTLFFS